MEQPKKYHIIKPLANGTDVSVISGEKRFNAKIEKSEWDFDQWIYFVNGEWYCQSEVLESSKYMFPKTTKSWAKHDAKIYLNNELHLLLNKKQI